MSGSFCKRVRIGSRAPAGAVLFLLAALAACDRAAAQTSQVPAGQQPVPAPGALPKTPLEAAREIRDAALNAADAAKAAQDQAKADYATGKITKEEYERIKNERREAKEKLKRAEAALKQAEKNARRGAKSEARGDTRSTPENVKPEPDQQTPSTDTPPAGTGPPATPAEEPPPGTSTGGTAPGAPASGPGSTPPPPPPDPSVDRPSPDQLACVLPYIVIYKITVLRDPDGHAGHISLGEQLVLQFALLALNQYSLIPQQARVAMLLFASGATGVLTPMECLFIAAGTGQAAGLQGVKWRLEMTAESPWKGTLTVGLDGTLPGRPIVYSLEETGRQTR